MTGAPEQAAPAEPLDDLSPAEQMLHERNANARLRLTWTPEQLEAWEALNAAEGNPVALGRAAELAKGTRETRGARP